MQFTQSRRTVALLTLVFILFASLLSPMAAGAAEDPETRPGATASSSDSRDFNPDQKVSRLYLAVLGRAPDAGGLAFWVGLFNSGTSLEAIANELSKSPEFVAKYGNLDNQEFVVELYDNVFDRRVDSGIDFWAGLLNDGTLTRSGLIVELSESLEFRNETFDRSPLDRLYCAFFLRPPDTGGLAFWTGLYRDNNVDLGVLASEFAASPEFQNTYGSLSDRGFVELIYKNVLGRPLPLSETAGPNHWTGVLGRNDLSRGGVMVVFSEAQEYLNRFQDGSCPEAGQATPVAVDDRGTVVNNGVVSINWGPNDVLPGGTTVKSFTQGSKGTVVNNGDGSFSYTHTNVSAAADTDSFTYTLVSVDGVESTATVAITILEAGADGIPTAVDDFFDADFQTAVVVAWAANDVTDATVSVESFTQPANGTVTNNGDNTFTYTPDTGFSGPDTFSYTLQDDKPTPDTSTATVTVTVAAASGVDDGITPVAVDDRAITPINTAVNIDWDNNDSLIDGGFLAEFTQPQNGTVTDNEDGSFSYVPDAEYTASRTNLGLVADSFSYTLRDNDAGVSTAVVEVIVLAEPACEVFVNYPYFTRDAAGNPLPPDFDQIELFFSDKGCWELYDFGTPKDVQWTNVTLNSAAATLSSEPGNPLREFVAVSQADRMTNRLDVQGTAVMTFDGATAVTVEFRMAFDWNGTTWDRDASVYRGRGPADVTVLINPLAP